MPGEMCSFSVAHLKARRTSFTRSFTLPEGVDGENVAADLKSGVLTLTVPKKPEVQPKKIVIGTGAKAPNSEPAKA